MDATCESPTKVVSHGCGRNHWPLLRSVSDEQVALYLEEHEPSLEAAIISAVEAQDSGQPGQSPALVGSAVMLQWLRFTPESILMFRIILAMVVAVVA